MPRVDRTWVRRLLPLLVAAVAVAVGYGLSQGLSGYLVYLAISAVTASIALLGLGIVTGSAGMIALCQLTFAAVGAWVVSLLNVHQAPGGFLVWLVVGALAAGLVGVLVGLPALRLRGVNLAVVTLGFAAAADFTLIQIQFPGSTDGVMVQRPGAFASDREFFFVAVIVLVVCALGVFALQRSRIGSSWRAIAFSERGSAAVGQSVSVAKLSAFAVSAALGGVSGGLIAGQVQLPFASSFSPLQSLALYVLAVMSGTHLIDMAIFGGVVWVLVPELLKRWGVSQDWGMVIFGVLGVQALASGSTLGQGVRDALRRRRGPATVGERHREATEHEHDGDATVDDVAASDPIAAAAAPVLEVTGLTVRFGALTALDGVDLVVPEGAVVGLIGPNGAGKSTFVDAVSGFLPGHEGTVRLDGVDLRRRPPAERARAGLRRTFQQDRVPPSLTVGACVRFAARRTVPAAEVEDALAFIGAPPASSRLADIDVGTRRLVEIAANLLARPRLLVLDEPAAGLSHHEHTELAQRIRALPARYGCAVIVIEHDLDLVRAVCTSLTVLDFGTVLASGPQQDVLTDPAVLKAYMGETEMLS